MRVSIWHKEKWKRGGMFEDGSAELILNLKYRLEERREKRGYYRHFAFQSRQRSKE